MSGGPHAPPFERSLAWSAAGHVGILLLALFFVQVVRRSEAPPPIEIEITSPYLGDGPAKLGAPKKFVPGKPAVVNVSVDVAAINPKKPAEPAKDWVMPRPDARKADPPPPPIGTPGGAPEGTGAAAKVGGTGEGSDEGVPGGHGHGGTPLLAFPKLLNREEVLAFLRRQYPEAERRANHEADVSVRVHISADGTVTSVDVVATAGPAFDEAARKVGKIMRFSPAIGLDGRPAPVAFRQSVDFRLTEAP